MCKCLICKKDGMRLLKCEEGHFVCENHFQFQEELFEKKKERVTDFHKKAGIYPCPEFDYNKLNDINEEYDCIMWDIDTIETSKCPVCQLDYIEDSILLDFLLKDFGKRRDTFTQELKEKYINLQLLKTYRK
jgi:hypothetical protein